MPPWRSLLARLCERLQGTTAAGLGDRPAGRQPDATRTPIPQGVGDRPYNAGNPATVAEGYNRLMISSASAPNRRRPNERLRAQRLRRAWSLEDVARKLVELAVALGERPPGVNATMVGRWERGEHTPRPPYPRLLCLLFDASPETLGLADPETAVVEELHLVGGRRAERPLHLSEETVRNLETMTAAYRRMYHTVGAHDLIDGIAEHVRTTRGFWRRTTDPQLGPSLAGITSEAAMLAGRMSFFDLGRPSEAEPYYQTALAAAEGAGDRALQAVVLGNQSFIPRNRGDFEDALRLLRQAKSLTSDQPTVRSWATALEAMTYLWARQPAKSLAAMEQAEALLAQARPEDRPAWFDYYDPARLAGFHGLLWIRLGDPETAQRILDRAIATLPAEAAKQRACYLADQATVQASAGEVERACQLGSEALQILSDVEYATGVQRVRDLRARLRPHRSHPAVADLTEQLLLVS
jgi:transcriptional regulator with XRE-family HTH domain